MSLLHPNAKAKRLGQLALFRDAPKPALEHLASAADEVTLPPARTLIEQGHHHAEGYILESGSLTVLVDDEEVATISPGEMVGELSLFGHGPASATVVTAETSTVLVIPYNRFDQILDESDGLAKAIAQGLAKRLHDMDARFHHL